MCWFVIMNDPFRHSKIILPVREDLLTDQIPNQTAEQSNETPTKKKKKKKAQGFHHQSWHTPCKKQPCDGKEAEWRGLEWSEESSLSESLSCMRVTLSASSVTPEFILAALTDVSTERCSTPQCLLTKAAVWPASVLTALTAFKEQRFYFFFFPLSFLGGWGRSASAVSFTLSLPSLRFLLIPVAASVQIIAPRHVHCLRWESCCLLYLWNSEKHAGPARQQHEIYIMWKIQGEFSCYTSLFRHLSEKKKIIRPQERLFLLISWPGG